MQTIDLPPFYKGINFSVCRSFSEAANCGEKATVDFGSLENDLTLADVAVPIIRKRTKHLALGYQALACAMALHDYNAGALQSVLKDIPKADVTQLGAQIKCSKDEAGYALAAEMVENLTQSATIRVIQTHEGVTPIAMDNHALVRSLNQMYRKKR